MGSIKILNVGVEEYRTAREKQDRNVELKNELDRCGDRNMRESENTSLTAQLADAQEVVRQDIIGGAPSIVTALATVLVDKFDRVELLNLDASLSETGHERRLGWAVENIVRALDDTGRLDTSQRRERRLRRARFVFDRYLEFALEREAARPRRLRRCVTNTKRSSNPVRRNSLDKTLSRPALRLTATI